MIRALALSLLVLVLAAPASAEPVELTAQALSANAAFLRSAVAPRQSATICLVDTGVDESPDTTAVVARFALDGSPQDRSPSRHGTEVAAFMAAPRNGYGMVGLWPRAQIVSVRANVAGQEAFTPTRYIEGLRMCLRFADAYAIKVALLPLTSGFELSDEEAAEFADVVTTLRAAEISVVAAAGNDGGAVHPPANQTNVVSVGAIDAAAGGSCAFSARGAQLLAPGCRLNGANPGDGAPTSNRQGTDVAAALVATALAALRTWRPDLSVNLSESLLRESARATDAGPVLDVASAFIAAGLESVVRWQPPLPGPATVTTPAAGAVTPGTRITLSGPATRRTAASVLLKGNLTGTDGSPLANTTVTVETRNLIPKSLIVTGARVPLAHVVTDTGGRFRVRIPSGPSRAVLVTHTGTTAQVNVVVPAQITARAARPRLRNGATAAIRGRVAGPIPDGGAPVALEVRDRGAWIPVPTTRRWVKTTGSGKFTLKYRFLRTFLPTTYRFRVVADEDSSFPYTRGTSRTIRVRVRP